MLQARRLGSHLLVGIHSDDAILANKGPTVMTLAERCSAVDACRWTTTSVPHAPYVTSLPWISHYGCTYVVHGDDITSDADGNDCYRFVKQAGRFKVVKRTPGISTTDLVGRMLLCTKTHHIRSLQDVLDGQEGSGSDQERQATGNEMRERMKEYASDETGLKPGPEVYIWQRENSVKPVMLRRRSSASSKARAAAAGKLPEEKGHMMKMFEGKPIKNGQRAVYVDGGFDLFSTGHIEFLRTVLRKEEAEAKKKGWYEEAAKKRRIEETGEDYGPAFIVAGVHDDETVNFWKGINYPIMNIFERGLCVLQCAVSLPHQSAGEFPLTLLQYIHAVVFNAPISLPTSFMPLLPHGAPAAIYHGPTSFMPSTFDPYADAKKLGIYQEVSHEYPHVNAGEIVDRILKGRAMYEERQRIKGVKGVGEEAVRRRESMERRAEEEKKEREKKWREIERQYSA